MKTMILDAPVFAFVVATRAALAGGIGLLVSERLYAKRRRGLGTALVALGAATTIPAAVSVPVSAPAAAASAEGSTHASLIGAALSRRRLPQYARDTAGEGM